MSADQSYNTVFASFVTELARKVEAKDLTYFAEGVVIAFVIFLFYLELNPKIGGIMFRPWSDGNTYFNPLGIIPVLKYPFQSLHFWKPQNWDLNFITFTAIGGSLFLAIRKSLEYLPPIKSD